MLKWDGSGAPTYNYATIPDYGRSYWVNNWTYEDRCWVASMSVDVLASFKEEIGAARKYILRSASEWGEFVMDTMYPPQAITMHKSIDITEPDFATNFGSGAVVVGIVGQGNTFNVNGAGYIVTAPSGLQTIINNCYNAMDGVWDEASLGADIGEALAIFGKKFSMSIQNPIQFINSCMWLPYTPSTGNYTRLFLGALDMGMSAQSLANPVRKFDFNIQIPTMSNIGRDRYWHLAEPYSHYKVVFPPFGTFTIPGPEVIRYDNGGGVATIAAQIVADAISGQATLSIPTLGICSSAQLGIPLELAGNSVDWAGAVQSVAGGIGSALTGGISLAMGAGVSGGGLISGTVNGIIAAESAMSPAATHGSIGGGMAALNSKRHSCLLYYVPAGEDPTEKGYALCEEKLISSLSGYVLCADGDIEAPATEQELLEIGRFLTGGFFYE